MKNYLYTIVLGIIFLNFYSCNPQIDEGIDLPNAPSASFSWDYLPGDENRVVFNGNPGDGFMHFWDFGNGLTSNQLTDTIFYPQMGDYDVTYSVFNAGGNGTAEQTIPIAVTVELPCEGSLELLTGCDNQKTWRFSSEEAAIGVGPAPYSIEWYQSPAGGLVPEQYADEYQFTFDGAFNYENYDCTINPFEGYICTALEVPDDLTFQFTEGTGTSGEDQVHLPACWFMGTWDSGPTYDIIELTETTLILHGAVQTGDCTSGEGYFTFKFIAQ